MRFDEDVCEYCFVERLLSDEEVADYQSGRLIIDCDCDGECYYCGEWAPIVTNYWYTKDDDDNEEENYYNDYDDNYDDDDEYEEDDE